MRKFPSIFFPKSLRTVLLTSLLALQLAAHAPGAMATDDDRAIAEMLKHMQDALQDLNYYGTLVYQHDGEIQSMRIIHKVDDSGEVEHIINLDGAGGEIFRKDDVVTCVIPERKMVMVGKRQDSANMLSKIAQNDFLALTDSYDFKLTRTGRVAGLETQRVDIIPRDRFRYGYRLWMDQVSKLLVRTDLLDEQGKLLEQAMFIEVFIVNRIPDGMLQPVTRNEGFTWYQEQGTAAMPPVINSQWQIGPLPAGFVVTGRFRHPMPETNQPAEHLVISDGMASVSIYIEKLAGPQQVFEGRSRLGVMNVFGALIEGHQITVIGDVPGQTVEQIAQAVVHQPGSAK